MLKVDLHTHSVASPDGGITQDEYMSLLADETLDYVAITDHNTIDFAKQLHKILGDKIIIGEEIMTRDGEIIGLFLSKHIKPGLSVKETMQEIHKQNGIIYIPHPLETVRNGLSEEMLEAHVTLIDIVESYNGRAVMQNRGPKATTWARLNHKPVAAASDAHGIKGVGTAFAVIKQPPTAENIAEQITYGHLVMHRPPLHTLLYPKANRLRRKLRRKR